MKIKEICKYLDNFFNIKNFLKIDVALNGLQVETENNNIQIIGTSVDASLETFIKAKELNIDLLIVHHGILWGSPHKLIPITDILGKRIGFLMKNNISLYGVHLPLDVHPEIGNNIQLANLLNANILGNFGDWKDIPIGIKAEISSISLEKLEEKLNKLLNTQCRVLNFGKKIIKRIGIITGEGANEILSAYQEDLDVLITGEGGHKHYHLIKELNMNIIYAGHYATETLGVKALKTHLERKFNDIKVIFIDNPTNF